MVKDKPLWVTMGLGLEMMAWVTQVTNALVRSLKWNIET